MPLYEYQCDACAHRFEVIQKFSDALVEVCPKCAGAVRKLVSSPAFQFKGSGWYITDYAKKPEGGGGAAKGEAGAATDKATQSDGEKKASSDAGKSESSAPAAPTTTAPPKAS